MSEHPTPSVSAAPGPDKVEPTDDDVEGRASRRILPVDAVDEDDVEGHGLGLTIAVSGAIVLGTVAAGAAAQSASSQVAPGSGASSVAVPSPQPGEAPASDDTTPETTVASTGRIGGTIHSGVYVVPVATTSVQIEGV